jgi:hypothetical protein
LLSNRRVTTRRGNDLPWGWFGWESWARPPVGWGMGDARWENLPASCPFRLSASRPQFIPPSVGARPLLTRGDRAHFFQARVGRALSQISKGAGRWPMSTGNGAPCCPLNAGTAEPPVHRNRLWTSTNSLYSSSPLGRISWKSPRPPTRPRSRRARFRDGAV